MIGGAPAAAVVFAGEVERCRGRATSGSGRSTQRIAQAEGAERQRLRSARAALWEEVLAQKRREFAERSTRVHSVERAVEVGSVSADRRTRPRCAAFLIEAVERGIRRALQTPTATADSSAAPPTNGRTRLARTPDS